MYEEDQSEIYNILLNPTTIVDNQNCVTEGIFKNYFIYNKFDLNLLQKTKYLLFAT